MQLVTLRLRAAFAVAHAAVDGWMEPLQARHTHRTAMAACPLAGGAAFGAMHTQVQCEMRERGAAVAAAVEAVEAERVLNYNVQYDANYIYQAGGEAQLRMHFT